MERANAQQAGYMELRGARKTGDCELVEVEGGISRELGCCNLFDPISNAVQQFKCGTCEHARRK